VRRSYIVASNRIIRTSSLYSSLIIDLRPIANETVIIQISEDMSHSDDNSRAYEPH
jgi:hypothetical protein